LDVWLPAVVNYIDHDVRAEEALGFIEETRTRPIKPFVEEAKRMISRRGSYTAALYG
jgi:hypothetical protein